MDLTKYSSIKELNEQFAQVPEGSKPRKITEIENRSATGFTIRHVEGHVVGYTPVDHPDFPPLPGLDRELDPIVEGGEIVVGVN